MFYGNFTKAQYTAVISDLHLCEAEPVNPKFPLWKKFKTRQFFFDSVFEEFLLHLEKKADGQQVELVLNGDIFDFDSVLTLPDEPSFRISWMERHRGLKPRPERSKFKILAVLRDHSDFFAALRAFILRGNRAVFIIGNHDLELHYPSVQAAFFHFLNLPDSHKPLVRFVDWFYISNKDTLIEHGNQYDPYCVCEDPINPFSQGYNYKTMKIPFGNLACRYLTNGMGFFNPHVDSNYIMTLPQYIHFFFRYMIRAQPELILTWLGGSLVTLWRTFRDRLDTPIKDPMKIEDRVNQIAAAANAEPRMVRELKELFVTSAAENPFLIARELWLDRAFLIFLGFFVILELMILVRQVFELSFFWAFIPLFLLLPFFLFYSKSIISRVSSYKEPDDRILSTAGAITKTNRIVYGHTHRARHEMIGAIEHLNSGTWSPAFLDVECTQAIDQKTFVWIYPEEEGRHAQLLAFKNGDSEEVFNPNRAQRKS
jgi:UDP-2,3-diacylglucosamine pyrophosphatase LpxH